MPSTRDRLDGPLRYLQTRSVNKGILGASSTWFWIGVITWGIRFARRTFGSHYELVYRGTLRPGEAVQIAHKAETYSGERVRSRRRKVEA